MTDRERLIDLMIEAKRTDPETGSFTDYLADYLLANGVSVLPCKVGDTVFRILTNYYSGTKCVKKTEISRIAIDDCRTWLFCQCNPTARSVLGKNVFLTREEAEQALKERDGS